MIRKDGIDHGQAFDWGQASQNYAKYRDIYPPEVYERMLALGLCTSGQRVLDIGTGTGVLPRHLARYGARFTGADISPQQIEEARRLTREAGLDVDYVVGPAEELAFPDASFDAVTAAQCFDYFDKVRLLPNLARMLTDGGRVCILFMAWLPGESEIAQGSEDIVRHHNPQWTGCGTHRHSYDAQPDWVGPLFTLEHSTSYDVALPFTRERWLGRMTACRGVGASSLPPDTVQTILEELHDYLGRFQEPFVIPHLVVMHVLKKT